MHIFTLTAKRSKVADNFTRMAKNTQLETITKIDIGAQSQLMPVAGSWVQLYFEVTNLRDVPSFNTYLLVDEQRFLRSLNPPSYV